MKTRKYAAVFLSAVCLASAAVVLTSDASPSGLIYAEGATASSLTVGFSTSAFTFSESDPGCLTGIKDMTAKGAIEIPSAVTKDGTTYDVDEIGAGALSGCTKATSFALPDTLTKIGASAFAGDCLLTGISLPAGVTEISAQTFSDCTALASASLPEGTEAIGKGAFEYCRSLSDVSGGTACVSIGEGAFLGCTSMKAAFLPDTVKTVGERAFMGTGIEGLTVPAGTEEIGAGAFTFCEALKTASAEDGSECFSSQDGVLFSKDGKKLILYPQGHDGTSYAVPAGTEEIGQEAFRGAQISSAELPEGVTSIGKDAFYQSRIESASLPESLLSIGTRAFGWCQDLKSIVLPDAASSVGAYCFCGCTGLESAGLPGTLSSLGEYVLSGCQRLKKLEIPGSAAGFGDYAVSFCPLLTDISYGGSAAGFAAAQAGGECVFRGTAAEKASCSDGECGLKKQQGRALRRGEPFKTRKQWHNPNAHINLAASWNGAWKGMDAIMDIREYFGKRLTELNISGYHFCRSIPFDYGTFRECMAGERLFPLQFLAHDDRIAAELKLDAKGKKALRGLIAAEAALSKGEGLKEMLGNQLWLWSLTAEGFAAKTGTDAEEIKACLRGEKPFGNAFLAVLMTNQAAGALYLGGRDKDAFQTAVMAEGKRPFARGRGYAVSAAAFPEREAPEEAAAASAADAPSDGPIDGNPFMTEEGFTSPAGAMHAAWGYGAAPKKAPAKEVGAKKPKTLEGILKRSFGLKGDAFRPDGTLTRGGSEAYGRLTGVVYALADMDVIGPSEADRAVEGLDAIADVR